MSEWQPIETAPHGVALDVWVRSKDNDAFGRRACNVCIINGKLIGSKAPIAMYGEYATHWMPLPNPPKAEGGGE